MHESQGEGFKCQSDLLKCFRINDKLFFFNYANTKKYK